MNTCNNFFKEKENKRKKILTELLAKIIAFEVTKNEN